VVASSSIASADIESSDIELDCEPSK